MLSTIESARVNWLLKEPETWELNISGNKMSMLSILLSNLGQLKCMPKIPAAIGERSCKFQCFIALENLSF